MCFKDTEISGPYRTSHGRTSLLEPGGKQLKTDQETAWPPSENSLECVAGSISFRFQHRIHIIRTVYSCSPLFTRTLNIVS